jgi:anti-anti-sigma factor
MSVKVVGKGRCKIIYKFDEQMSTAKSIEAEKNIINKIGIGDKVIFDLAGVKYITSSFLCMCLKAVRRVSIENFSIINTGPSVERIFEITGLCKRLNITKQYDLK